MFEDVKEARKKVMRITTDSRPMEQSKEPEGDHLYQLYSLFVDDAARDAMAAKYRAGGFGYGEIKKALADAAEAYFAGPREKRAELERSPDMVRDILADGARRARETAAGVLDRAQKACGVKTGAALKPLPPRPKKLEGAKA
jgi:tryptophanyl-tRNA synthetase